VVSDESCTRSRCTEPPPDVTGRDIHHATLMADNGKIRLIRIYLMRVAKWLWRIRGIGIAFGPVIACVGALIYLHWAEPSIRVAGLVLQLFGLASVAKGVSDMRRQFGHPTIVARIGAFFGDWPRIPRPITGNINITLEGFAAASSTASATLSTSTYQTPDARLLALEQRVNEMVAQAANDNAEIRSQIRKHVEQLDVETARRSEGDARLHQQLEVSATGGLDLSLYGVVWLFFGIIFSTISPEIARLI
jgi:hypothetical protein